MAVLGCQPHLIFNDNRQGRMTPGNRWPVIHPDAERYSGSQREGLVSKLFGKLACQCFPPSLDTFLSNMNPCSRLRPRIYVYHC